VLIVPRRWRTPAAIVGGVAVLLVSYSRIALGVHYLSDVIGGWLLGAAWLVAASLAYASGWPRARHAATSSG
jgi:undecaprenyl-diphosphatase